MNNVEEITQKGKTVWESCKKIFSLLKERKWFSAFKESFTFLKLIYVNHLKGKYIIVKGKKIPRTLIAVLALFIIYIALPSQEERPTGEQPLAEAANVKKDSNIFDKNGLKVYDLRKCETEKSVGVCGLIEDYGDKNFAKVTVIINFHAPDGRIVYEGGVEATDVESHTRMKINAPCSEEFAYFKLKDVKLESKNSNE